MSIAIYVLVSVGVAYWLHRLEKKSIKKHREATARFSSEEFYRSRRP